MSEQLKSDEATNVASVMEKVLKVEDDAGKGRGVIEGAREETRSPRGARGGAGSSDVVRTRQSTFDKCGSSGRAIKLKANCFKIDELPDFNFNQYHVDFEPELDEAMIRKALVGQQLSQFGGYLYDGTSTLFITTKLPEDIMHFPCKTREGKEYKLTLKFTKVTIENCDSNVFRVLNIMLRRAMEGLNLKLIQRNLFDPGNKIDINEFNLNLWPGYETSIRQYEKSALLNCDMRFKVMRKDTLYDILRICLRDSGATGKDNFKAQMLGSIVLATYGTQKTYRVEDVDFSVNPTSTFNWKGRDISYVDYFQEQYGIKIKYLDQPMIISKPKDRDFRGSKTEVSNVCLVPELCVATGLTDTMRNNFQLMRALADHTRMDPKRRVERLLNFNKRLQASEASIKQFTQFHMKLNPELVEFTGREIAQESMIFGENKQFQNEARNVDWTNAMKTNYMYTNVDLKKWAVVVPSRSMNDFSKFLGLLKEVASGMKYTMGEPKILTIDDDRVGTYANKLQEIIKKDPTLLMVVLPNNSADRYAAVKKITCVTNAVPTQVIVQKTMMPKKGNMGAVKSVATKVLIQMNCKLGGAAWTVKIPISGLMVVGFDVTHDTANKRNSYGAFVAALDIKEKARFYSSVSQHNSTEECSQNIAIHMQKALMAYKQICGSYPERILFYRDGVGDGDLEYVVEFEVKALLALFAKAYPSSSANNEPNVKFCFIVVNKRINMRIFKSNGTVDNPFSGTVVDNTITMPERYDFYLISQSVRQGTVAPTLYNVIYDTFGLTPDRLQILTYKMCHLYYNWSGTTRVPAVVQYCQKLALLVGQHLHALPIEKLDNQLYFL